jgi:uncharacterized protein (TIGR03437 family)
MLLLCRKSAFLALFATMAAHAQLVSTTAGRQQDLNYVANQLPQVDVNFFSQLDRGTYQQAVAALQAKISTATDPEFYVGLAQLVAMSNDMHTSLTPGTPFAYGFLPLSLVWLEDGLFVVSASPIYAQTIGTQVAAVNGMPIDRVVQLLGTAFAHANDQWLHSQVAVRLTSLFMLQGLGIIPFKSTTVPITFQTLGGDHFTATIGLNNDNRVSGLPRPTPDYLQNAGSYYWYSYIATNRVIYAKYNICENDPNGISVATYSAQILQTLDTNPVDTVVIDFRENSGGNEYLLYPLGLGLFQRLSSLRANPNFRIYLVIDKGSFSSGMYTPMAFKSGYLATYEGIPMPDTSGIMYVIGEPTGGKPTGFGDVVGFTLPYSQAAGDYSTDYINQDEGVIPDLPSFNPDIFVPTRSTDYFAGHDPVMAAMLARFTGAPPAPSGTLITVNGASFHTDQGLAPGSFASAFGNFPVTPDQILVGGVAGVILSAGLSQVNFVVPASVTPGLATISVRAASQELANGQATITPEGPGIFVLDPTNPSQPGAVENQDYSINSPANPASRGSAISIYATGYGRLDSSGRADAQVYFGDMPARVLYSAPVDGIPGLWQINVQVPATVSPGVIALFLVAGNVPSNAVIVAVE